MTYLTPSHRIGVFGYRAILLAGISAIIGLGIFCFMPVGRMAQVIIDSATNGTSASHNGTSPTSVFIDGSVGYTFYRDSDGSCVYAKTTDGGLTWGAAVSVDPQTDCIRVAIWYDRWTPGDTTGIFIHIATIDSGSNNVWYTRLNTSSDSLTTTVSASDTQGGTFAAGANHHSITKGTDGDLYIGIEDGSDSYVVTCIFGMDCTSGLNWIEAGLNPFDLATDWLILMPLSGGDILAIRWDISANTIDSKVYNGMLNVWDVGWTTIDANALENGTYEASFGATVKLSNGDIYLAYAADASSLGTDDDVRTAIYSGGAWTSKTDVLTNDARGLTGVKIGYDQANDIVYAVYSARTSPGTAASGNVYAKPSSDGMGTWDSEVQLNVDSSNIFGARINILSSHRLYATWFTTTGNTIYGNIVADATLSPPVKPANISPANDDSGLSQTPTLSASAFSDPNIGDTHAASQWQASAVSGDYTGAAFDSGATTTALTSIGISTGFLSASTTYFWHVRYRDNTGTFSSYSDETSFKTSIPPRTPSITAPADGSANQSILPTLSATGFIDDDVGQTHVATEWQIDDNADFGSVEWSRTSGSGETSAAVGASTGAFSGNRAGKSTLGHGTTYNVRVRYQDSIGIFSAFSGTVQFSTNAIQQPINILPSASSTVITLSPLLVASDFSDPASTHTHAASQWQIALSSSFISTVYDSGSTASPETFHSVPSGNLSNNITYYWRVRYKDSEGDFSAYSSGTAFTIQISEQSVLVRPISGHITVNQGNAINLDVQTINFTDGTPLTNATGTISIYDPFGTKIVNEDPMVYLAGSRGVYRYPFTVPFVSGSYLYEVSMGVNGKVGVAAANFEVRTVSSDITALVADFALHETAESSTRAVITSNASNLDILLGSLVVVQSTVNDVATSASSFLTGLVNTVADFYKNAVLTFTSGSLDGQSRRVSGYDSSTKKISVDPALSFAPANGDAFTITKQNVYVEEQVADVSSNITSVSTSIENVSSSVAGISSNITGVSTSIENVSSSVANVGAGVAGVASGVASISTSIEYVSSSIAGITTSLADLHDKVDDITTTLNTIDTSLDTVQITLDAIRASQTLAHTVQLSDVASIELGGTYRVKLVVTDHETSMVNATGTPTITIYDASRAIAVASTAMTQLANGVYEFVHDLPTDAQAGLWESVVATDLGGAEPVLRNDYWLVTGAPAQVVIDSIPDTTTPSIVMRVRITNEGNVPFEYQYEWCAVVEQTNPCGGGDDTYHASAAKLIQPGDDFVTDLALIIPTPGQYYVKIVVHFGGQSSGASRLITVTEEPAGVAVDTGISGIATSSIPPPSLPVPATPIVSPEGNLLLIEMASLRGELFTQSSRLTEMLTLLATVGMDTSRMTGLIEVNETNTSYLKDVQNKVADMRAVSTIVRRLAGETPNVPIIQAYMRFNSVELRFIISNPQSIENTIRFRSFLPEEARPEHVLNADGLSVEYDATAKTYYVIGDFTLAPGASVIKTVELKDIWIIDEAELNLLIRNCDAVPTDCYEILALARQITEDQNAGYSSPQEHILIYRKNMERMERIRVHIADMRGGSTKTETQTAVDRIPWTMLIVTFIAIALLMATLLCYQIFMDVRHGRRHYSKTTGSQRRPAKKEKASHGSRLLLRLIAIGTVAMLTATVLVILRHMTNF